MKKSGAGILPVFPRRQRGRRAGGKMVGSKTCVYQEEQKVNLRIMCILYIVYCTLYIVHVIHVGEEGIISVTFLECSAY